MNEQIEKIYGEACILYGDLSEREFCEKFAELIVEECINICISNRNDDSAQYIEKHFGVEE
jgi:hypothetical protein